MSYDEKAHAYMQGVKKANPQDFPTWEMLETAFVAGIQEILIEQSKEQSND